MLNTNDLYFRQGVDLLRLYTYHIHSEQRTHTHDGTDEMNRATEADARTTLSRYHRDQDTNPAPRTIDGFIVSSELSSNGLRCYTADKPEEHFRMMARTIHGVFANKPPNSTTYSVSNGHSAPRTLQGGAMTRREISAKTAIDLYRGQRFNCILDADLDLCNDDEDKSADVEVWTTNDDRVQVSINGHYMAIGKEAEVGFGLPAAVLEAIINYHDAKYQRYTAKGVTVDLSDFDADDTNLTPELLEQLMLDESDVIEQFEIESAPATPIITLAMDSAKPQFNIYS